MPLHAGAAVFDNPLPGRPNAPGSGQAAFSLQQQAVSKEHLLTAAVRFACHDLRCTGSLFCKPAESVQ